MKFLYPFIVLILISSCKEANNKKNGTDSSSNLIEDIKLLNSEDYITPVQTFIDFANNNAKQAITINKSNIKDALKKAKKHKFSAIVVGAHTVIKIIDFNDCKQSGAWGICMPKAEGYIKKGTLNYKNDYINNIIGIPDNQHRKLYLFD